VLARVPLGPRPSLHRLRRQLASFVRQLRSYYGEVRLLMPVHHRLRLLAFPLRTSDGGPSWSNMRSPGSRTRSVHTCQGLRPRRAGRALAVERPSVSPSAFGTASAPGLTFISQLNGWPMRFPADASQISSRVSPHGSGPMWLATPSSQRDLHHLLLAGLPAHTKANPIVNRLHAVTA
jgi:hypothetical protein